MVVTGAPTHVEDTVQEIARLRAEHDRRASPLQRTVERFTARVRNVSTTLRQPSVEFKLGFLEFSSVN
jgi:hypothetical protein